jgi:hypothetical protein
MLLPLVDNIFFLSFNLRAFSTLSSAEEFNDLQVILPDYLHGVDVPETFYFEQPSEHAGIVDFHCVLKHS